MTDVIPLKPNTQPVKPATPDTPPRSILTEKVPVLPPHFWVSGWDWLGMPLEHGQAISVFVSLSQPAPKLAPFLVMSKTEHDYYLKLNRSQVWLMAIDLLKQVGMDPNTFILEARRLGQKELEIL